MDNKEIISKVEDYLKVLIEYLERHYGESFADMKIGQIMKKEVHGFVQSIEVHATFGNEVIIFNPLEELSCAKRISLMYFNEDIEVFLPLSLGHELVYMSEDFHLGVWTIIAKEGVDTFWNTDGLQKYMDFCQQTHVTKESLPGYDGMDILSIYHSIYRLR